MNIKSPSGWHSVGPQDPGRQLSSPLPHPFPYLRPQPCSIILLSHIPQGIYAHGFRLMFSRPKHLLCLHIPPELTQESPLPESLP